LSKRKKKNRRRSDQPAAAAAEVVKSQEIETAPQPAVLRADAPPVLALVPAPRPEPVVAVAEPRVEPGVREDGPTATGSLDGPVDVTTVFGKLDEEVFSAMELDFFERAALLYVEQEPVSFDDDQDGGAAARHADRSPQGHDERAHTGNAALAGVAKIN
jgi:hypothetical protein